MLDQNQIARLAAMGNALRVDWPAASLYTHIAQHHAHRAYRDVAVALAYIAADDETNTPARLREAGPWWQTTTPADRMPRPSGRCRECQGFHGPAAPHDPPPSTRAADHIAQLRTELSGAKSKLCSHGVPPDACYDHSGRRAHEAAVLAKAKAGREVLADTTEQP